MSINVCLLVQTKSWDKPDVRVAMSDFKSFHAGGSPSGLQGLLKNVGPTVQACWDDTGMINMGDTWETKVIGQAREAYGFLNLEERDLANRRVLEAIRMVTSLWTLM